MQFALPGIPSIYYGDEVGLTGFRDPYCRMGYPYGKEDMELLSYFQALGNLRKTYREDFSKPIEYMTAIRDVVYFSRGDLLFVINAGEYDENVKIKSNFVTIFGCENIKIQEDLFIIPAGTFGVLHKK